jgi:hypothetical protein
LIIGVGTYLNNPSMNLPECIYSANYLYETLLKSDNWKSSHIMKITGENATLENILYGFKWLSMMDEKNDVSLVYLATHGGILTMDIPPFDEDDAGDEYLIPFEGIDNPSKFLWDDELQFLLNRLDSEGVCVIIDSCHSGGFAESENILSTIKNDEFSQFFIQELSEDISGNGRVVLMACEENELSYGGSFASYIIGGLDSLHADINGDDICSAEEVYMYAKKHVEKVNLQHPCILDNYDGDLLLTGLITDSDYHFFPHLFDKKYSKNIEEIKNEVLSVNNNEEVIDQQETHGVGIFFPLNKWNPTLAQSFSPKISPLSKIDIYFYTRVYPSPPSTSLNISIREELEGENIIHIVNNFSFDIQYNWITIDFDDIEVEINKTYYIVIEPTIPPTTSSLEYGWIFNDISDPYERGVSILKDQNGSWDVNSSLDFCFRTYGTIEDVPPNRPDCPRGLNSIKPGEMISYSTLTTDENDMVYYLWDWGDGSQSGWLGPFESGQSISEEHSWAKKGVYSVQVKSKDIWGVESKWSDPLPISVPQYKGLMYHFITYLRSHLLAFNRYL